MDNQSRSERSRQTAIRAALAIIAREGPGGLTFDALARESGISKGGLLHQFRTKNDILVALLENQMQSGGDFAQTHFESVEQSSPEPRLAAQIAVLRESATDRHPASLALLAALVESPKLLESVYDCHNDDLSAVRAEAVDGDLAVLRWAAAIGATFTKLLGISALTAEERESLFARLMDHKSWQTQADS